MASQRWRKAEERGKHWITCADYLVENHKVSLVFLFWPEYLWLLHLPVATAAKEINELWMEYEANLSPEAKVVKDFDKVHVFTFYILYDLQMLSLDFTLLLMDNSFADSLCSHQRNRSMARNWRSHFHKIKNISIICFMVAIFHHLP